MSLNDRLFADMKEAMKEKEAGKIRLSTIRMIRAAQKEAEIDKKRELTDDELIDIINRELKKRKEAIADYEKADRPEMVKQLEEEIKVLQGYLPEQLGEDQIILIIKEAIQEIGANGPKDLGLLMKTVMPKLKGRADGKLISELAKKMLQ